MIELAQEDTVDLIAYLEDVGATSAYAVSTTTHGLTSLGRSRKRNGLDGVLAVIVVFKFSGSSDVDYTNQ